MNIKDLLKFLKALIEKLSSPKPKSNSESLKPTKEPSVKKTKRMLYVKNDSERLNKELIGLKTKNEPLYELILDLHQYIDKTYDKDIIITMIYRTQEEQDYLYRNSEKYKKKPFKSPHQFNQAVDIRSWLYTEGEIEDIVEYLNTKYNDSNYYRWTAKVHEVGNNGIHFHIQYYKK